MKSELKKRASTSIILFLLIYLCIFVNLYVTLISLIILSIISWFEFIKLINKIYSSKNEILSNLIIVISALYLTTFAGVSYFLIELE